jgi:hypothetical protein
MVEITLHIIVAVQSTKTCRNPIKNQILIQNFYFTPNPRKQHKPNLHLLPLNIIELIAKKRIARSRWQRTRLSSDKHTFNNLANTIKKLILKHKMSIFN